MIDETMTVYHDESESIHFPSRDGSTQTACGLDAAPMRREERPMEWAGVWCTACLRTLAGVE